MIEDKDLGLKVAETSDEAFWTELKQKCKDALKAEERNIKINQKMIELSEQELSVKA